MVRNGPAENAGLEGSEETMELEGMELPVGGDIIVAIDGDPVETIDDVIAYLVANTRPEQEVAMEVLRDGETVQLTVKLGTRPGPIGATAQPLHLRGRLPAPPPFSS